MSENIFTNQTPATTDDAGGGTSRVLGVVFKASVAGTISAVRWYGPGSGPSGTASAHFFSMTNPNDTSGTLLGSQNFGTITNGAWNTATFSSPIAISPSVPYCAQIFTGDHYDYTGPSQWASDFTNAAGHLTVYAASTSNNGRFKNSPGAATDFPNNSSGGGFNFFVDVVFTPGSSTSDSVTTADSLTSNVVLPRATSDSVTTADTLTRTVILPRGPANSVTTADTAAGIVTPVNFRDLIITFGRLDSKWLIGGPAVLTYSVLDRRYVRLDTSATAAGVSVDPRGDTVQMAFLSTTANPQNADWQTASWDVTGVPGHYWAQCLIGPGGTIALSAGTYYVWVKVVDNPEIPVAQVGQIQIV